MEPLLNAKREVAAYVPYRVGSDGPSFFLQMRDGSAPVHANMFSLFGGGVEAGENLFEAFERETFEELSYKPVRPVYFACCESSSGRFHVFVEEVGTGFEELVDVQEGEYGKFIRCNDMNNVPISPIARLVVTDISEWLVPRGVVRE